MSAESTGAEASRRALPGAWERWTSPLLSGDEAPRVLLVTGARNECLRDLVLDLGRTHPESDVFLDHADLANAPSGSVHLLLPEDPASPSMGSIQDVTAERRMAVVLWLDKAREAALTETHGPVLETWACRSAGCTSAPQHGVSSLLAAGRAPGVEWLDGDLAPCLAEAFPGTSVHWVSAKQPYAELVRAAEGNSAGWLCWTDIDGPFRLRQTRWALAEARHWGRSVLVDAAISSPGWWPAHSRMADLSSAAARLAAVGARHPARLAVLAGLEPEAIDLLELLLDGSLGEDELTGLLRDAHDPGVSLAVRAREIGVFSLDDVATRLVAPPIQRAFGGDGAVQDIRSARFQAVGRQVMEHECVPMDLLGHWAAASRNAVPVEALDWATGPATAWLVEVALRQGPATAEDWRALADAAIRLGDPHVATRWADKAAAFPELDDVTLSRVLFTRARARFRDGSFHEAEGLLLECLEIQERALGPDHLETARTLNAMGLALARQRRFPQALSNYTRALEVERARLPEDHEDIAVTLHAIGQVMIHLGRYEEARRAFDQALAIKEKALGPEHPSTASTLHAIGQALARQGRHVEAFQAFKRDLRITEKALGPEHPSVANTLHAIGQALVLAGQFEDALDAFQRELSIVERALGAEHPNVAEALDMMGQALVESGRAAEAVDIYKRALHVKEVALGPQRLETAATLHAMGQALSRSGDPEAALDSYSRALHIRENAQDPGNAYTAVTLHAMGQVLARMRRYPEAIAAFDRALSTKEKALGPEHPETAITRFERGRAMRDSGDPTGVAQMMGATSLLERELGPEHPMVKAARTTLY